MDDMHTHYSTFYFTHTHTFLEYIHICLTNALTYNKIQQQLCYMKVENKMVENLTD